MASFLEKWQIYLMLDSSSFAAPMNHRTHICKRLHYSTPRQHINITLSGNLFNIYTNSTVINDSNEYLPSNSTAVSPWYVIHKKIKFLFLLE